MCGGIQHVGKRILSLKTDYISRNPKGINMSERLILKFKSGAVLIIVDFNESNESIK